jgi:transketolase
MEGVSAEAASLAGHLQLAKLVWVWDDNRITIEGGTELAFTEDVGARFRAYGWRVLEAGDVNDLEQLAAVFDEATDSDSRPTLVRVRSRIAWGAPNLEGKAAAHGAPLGEDETRATKRGYGWPEDASFLVPPEVLERCREWVQSGAKAKASWDEAVAVWAEAHPQLAGEWARRLELELPPGWAEALPTFEADGKKMATRVASGKVLNALASEVTELIGGSADLAPSCKTIIESDEDLVAGSFAGRNMRFGIREHAMGAILNGLALHGGLRPYGSTFLVFSDYMRPSIRLAALMELPVVYIFTHDSIWVGEDGPTHQPVEHLSTLRAIPGLVVLRPADANETAAAWRVALERTAGPTCLLLSRQGLPVLAGVGDRTPTDVFRGAYVLAGGGGDQTDVILVATGGEVALALAARAELERRGVAARVVSMPSWELFAEQSDEYRHSVLPPGSLRLAVEAGVPLGWHRWVGDEGEIIGIDRFGASAPGAEVAEHLGLSVEEVVESALALRRRGV